MTKTNGLNHKTNKYGTATLDGVTVELTEQAEMTGRLLPDHQSHLAEWSAPAKRADGSDATVYWLHDNDSVTLPEDLPWDDIDRIEDADQRLLVGVPR